MLAVFRGPLGEEKRERQGKAPGCCGAAWVLLEWQELLEKVVTAAAQWRCSVQAEHPWVPRKALCVGEGALHVPSKAAWFVSWDVISGQPHSRCYWHPSLNWFELKAHVQNPVQVPVVCAPSSSPNSFPWHRSSIPNPSPCWDPWRYPPLHLGREPGYTMVQWWREAGWMNCYCCVQVGLGKGGCWKAGRPMFADSWAVSLALCSVFSCLRTCGFVLLIIIYLQTY